MSILTAVLAVFSGIAEWFVEIIPTLTAMFYNSTDGLTFLGILCTCGLGVSIILLVMGIIQGFLHFRG